MNEKILIVDDEPKVVRLVSQVLKAMDYQVISAASGEPALEMVALEQPDLVFLDVRLPGGMDGYEICRRIREFSDVAVIMLTAKALESDVLCGFDAGHGRVHMRRSGDELCPAHRQRRRRASIAHPHRVRPAAPVGPQRQSGHAAPRPAGKSLGARVPGRC